MYTTDIKSHALIHLFLYTKKKKIHIALHVGNGIALREDKNVAMWLKSL